MRKRLLLVLGLIFVAVCGSVFVHRAHQRKLQQLQDQRAAEVDASITARQRTYAASVWKPAGPVTLPAGTGDGWPEYGGNLAGQRYSAARQVTPENVGQLQVAWTFHTHALDVPSDLNKRALFEATPLLWKNTLYLDSPFDQVFALDAATGKPRWNFDPQVDRSKGAYIVSSRGVAMWHATHPVSGTCGSDRVLLATLDRRLIALDANSGKPCPGFGNGGAVDLSKGVEVGVTYLYFFTSPPTVVGDTIVMGSSVGDNQVLFAASGAVRGFDVLTGRQKWSWEPVRWTANQHPKLSGSGNAWAPLSADLEHDLVFVPTGSPSVDFWGGKRLGDDRDADSLVALRASTGEKVWSYQLVHHDLWDYDTPSQPMLFTFRGSIPAVAVVTKSDMIFVFNRLTGQPLFPVVERPVAQTTLPDEQTWPTQPFSTLPSLGPLSITATDVRLNNKADEQFCRTWINRLDNHGLFTPPSIGGSLESPGNAGGANWGSVAFDPTTAVMYTRVTMMPYIIRMIPKLHYEGTLLQRLRRHLKYDLPYWAGGNPLPLHSQFKTPDQGGNALDEDDMGGSPYTVNREALMAEDGTACGIPPFGSIVAINLNTGKKLWTVPHGMMVRDEPGSSSAAGVIATGGGLLFIGASNDAFMRAYDAISGRELWRGQLPTASTATPMTYEIDGKQFVVIAVGGIASVRTGFSDSVMAFALPEAKAPASKASHVR